MSDSERTTAERITLAISLGILIAILVTAGWTSLGNGNAEPVIEVEANLEDVREIDGTYYVDITVTNSGGKTAQDMTVTGEVTTGEPEPESADITFDFLAGGESETAVLTFTTLPTLENFTLNPASFRDP